MPKYCGRQHCDCCLFDIQCLIVAPPWAWARLASSKRNMAKGKDFPSEGIFTQDCDLCLQNSYLFWWSCYVVTPIKRVTWGRPEASVKPPWILEGDLPPVQLLNDSIHSQHLNCSLWEALNQRTHLSCLQKLTPRNWDYKYCFKSLSFRVICYAAIDH